jgi:hypothetical protein
MGLVHETSVEPRRAAIMVGLLQGKTCGMIAQELGLSYECVRRWAAEPEFRVEARALWDKMFEEVGQPSQALRSLKEQMKEAASTAVSEIISLAKNGVSEKTRLSACVEILERADVGLEKKQQQTVQAPTIILDQKFLLIAKQAAAEMDGLTKATPLQKVEGIEFANGEVAERD